MAFKALRYYGMGSCKKDERIIQMSKIKCDCRINL